MKHTARTSVGFSGGPIIAQDISGNFVVVGIHTHRGEDNLTNSGLCFNSEIMKKIGEYLNDLSCD